MQRPKKKRSECVCMCVKRSKICHMKDREETVKAGRDERSVTSGNFIESQQGWETKLTPVCVCMLDKILNIRQLHAKLWHLIKRWCGRWWEGKTLRRSLPHDLELRWLSPCSNTTRFYRSPEGQLINQLKCWCVSFAQWLLICFIKAQEVNAL